MTGEAQLVALHEWMGWTKIRLAIKGAGGGNRKPTPHGVPPNRNYEAPLNRLTLDLMHESRAKMNQAQRDAYGRVLRGLVTNQGTATDFDIANASALQHLKATLITIGLWT